MDPEAQLRFDTSEPGGSPRKLPDDSRLNNLGWSATTDLGKGIQREYDWFVTQHTRNVG